MAKKENSQAKEARKDKKGHQRKNNNRCPFLNFPNLGTANKQAKNNQNNGGNRSGHHINGTGNNTGDTNMKNRNNIFWIFGTLKAITLGLIIFIILRALNTIGKDTQAVLSILFPLFLLIVEYMIYSKK